MVKLVTNANGKTKWGDMIQMCIFAAPSRSSTIKHDQGSGNVVRDEWTLAGMSQSSPQQANYVECGVLLCANALCAVENHARLSTNDIPNIRKV